MPQWVKVTAGLFLLLAVIGAVTDGDREAAPKDPDEAAAIAQATATLKREPKIKDLTWTGPMLYVGVLDDGSPRHGYAMYVCEVLRDFGSPAKVVHVMDVAAIKFRNDWRKLGTAHCR
mgnify:CR=1 FL=1